MVLIHLGGGAALSTQLADRRLLSPSPIRRVIFCVNPHAQGEAFFFFFTTLVALETSSRIVEQELASKSFSARYLVEEGGAGTCTPFLSSCLLNLVEDGGTGTGSFTSPLRELVTSGKEMLGAHWLLERLFGHAHQTKLQAALGTLRLA